MRKNTIYQNLTKLFNIDDGFEATQTDDKNKKIIIKGSSPEDIKLKALEIGQKKALEKKFHKGIDSGLQKSMQYEAARLPAYLDYEGMEYYPIVASALDLYMEEITSLNDQGEMINIYSNNPRVKESLLDLFHNVINVNVNLPFWARSLIKYGDNFVNILGVKGKGITQAKQLINYDIERLESVIDGVPTIKFKNRTTSDIYNIFEVLHFRILGDSKYIPYGSSILNKIRRVFRQLVMAEDAMLTARIIRSADRRVYKIDVGNMDNDDVDEYIMNIATKYIRKQSVDRDSGQIDYRFNILGYDEDIFLPQRNGNSQTGVDTLEGLKNTDIHDIEFLRDNLFAGLSIPKPFLGFQDTAGSGKNLAQYDIRFAQKVVRIQQAIIQELNKLAIIHLYYQGFSKEEINDFKLTLNNPSTQEELLKVELLKTKADLYQELTKTDGGIAIMSHTLAKKRIFNMTDDEIILDLKRQRIERAVAAELEATNTIITSTGIFTKLDNKMNLVDTEENEVLPAQEQGDTTGRGQDDVPPPLDQEPGEGGIPEEQEINDSFNHLLGELTKKDKVVTPEVVTPKVSYNNLTHNKELLSEMNTLIGKPNEESNIEIKMANENDDDNLSIIDDIDLDDLN